VQIEMPEKENDESKSRPNSGYVAPRPKVRTVKRQEHGEKIDKEMVSVVVSVADNEFSTLF
jgi:hypothetical protein